MLAQRRGARAGRGGRGGELERKGELAHLPSARLRELEDHTAAARLRSAEGLLERQDRLDAGVLAPEALDPLGKPAAPDDLPDRGDHLGLRLRVGLARDESLAADHATEAPPELLLERAHAQVTSVGGLVNVVARELA